MLWLQYIVNVTSFPMITFLYFEISTFWGVYVSSVQYGCFLSFPNIMLSRYFVQQFSYLFIWFQLPILLLVSLCFYIPHTLYFYCYVLFIIILLLSSPLIFHFCVHISKFLIQLSWYNNITITLVFHAWKFTNTVFKASCPGRTSRFMWLGLWIL